MPLQFLREFLKKLVVSTDAAVRAARLVLSEHFGSQRLGTDIASRRFSHFPGFEARRLERRRVFAVDASFQTGLLQINITNSGFQDANLLANGSNFFVDGNNNFLFDPTEVSGNISDLQSVLVRGPGQQGNFYWGGDFRTAPLQAIAPNPISVDAAGVAGIHIASQWTSSGNVSLHASDAVLFDSEIRIGGDLSVQTSTTGTITDAANAKVSMSGNFAANSGGSILLADQATNTWKVSGTSLLQSSSAIELGNGGSWDANQLGLVANSAFVKELNRVEWLDLNITHDLTLYASGNVSDAANAKAHIGGDLSIFTNGSVRLGDTPASSWTSDGFATIYSQSDVDLGSAGVWDANQLSIKSLNATVRELNDITLFDHEIRGTYQLQAGHDVQVDGFNLFSGSVNITAQGNLTDTAGVDVLVYGTTTLKASGPITLADVAGDSWAITGTANLQSASNVSLGQSGVWDSSRLEINAVNALVNDVSAVTIGNSLITGNYQLVSGGDTVIDGTISVAGNWSIDAFTSQSEVTDQAADIQVSGNLFIHAYGPITLADTSGTSWRIAGQTELVTLGAVALGSQGKWDANELAVKASSANVLELNDVAIFDHEIRGPYQLTAGGDIRVSGFNLFSSTTNLTAAKSISDDPGVEVIVFGALNLNATGPIILADNFSDAWSISSTARIITNSNVFLGQNGSWDSSKLEITASSAIANDINGVTIGNSQVAGNYLLSAGGNLLVDGTVNVNGDWNITTTNAGTITDSNSAIVKILGNSNLQSAGAITLADTANAAWTIGGTANLSTAGNVSLGQGGSWDSTRLEINSNNATVTDINGVTIGNSQVSSNYLLNAGGNVVVDGIVNVSGNWNIKAQGGSITDSDSASVSVLGNALLQASTTVTLADTPNANWTLRGQTSILSNGRTDLGSTGHWDSNELSIKALNATVREFNDVTIFDHEIRGPYQLTAGGNIVVSGFHLFSSTVDISTDGNLTDTSGVDVLIFGVTDIRATGFINLADNTGDSWAITGTARLNTPSNVNLGQGGSWDSSRLEINSNNATVTDINGVTIGNSQVTGNYLLNAGGNINVDGIVNVNGNWNITTTNAGTITDSNAAFVKTMGNAKLQSAGAITLADTPNASWFIGGTAGLATLGNVSLGQGGSWDSSRLEINANNATVTDINGVTIGNSQLAGNYILSAGGNINVDGTVNVNGNWNITTTNAGTITDSNLAVVKVLGNANLQSSGNITLADTANASWTIGGSANLVTPGNVSLGQGGSWDSSRLEINANNATVTDINGVTIGNSQLAGNYILSAGGNINVDGTINVNGNWNITTTNAGTINDSNLAVVKTLGNATLQAAGAITLADTTNASWTVGGTANVATPGNVSLGQGGSWDSSRLEINANNASVTDINGVTIGDSQIAGNYGLSAGGNLIVDGTVNVNGNWNITTTNAGTVTDSNAAVVKILGNTNLQAANAITLADTANASWTIGGTANLATPGNASLGQGGSWDSSRLEISANNATVTDINGVTIGNSQLAGNYILSAGGNTNVDGAVNVNGSWNITTTNAGTITDSNLAVVKVLGNANLQSSGNITLADTANASWTIGGTANLVTPGNVSLGQGGSWDSSRLEINANNATVTDINGVTIGNSQLAGNYGLSAGGNVNVDGTVNVNGNWNITTTNAGTITDSNSAIVKVLGNANLQAAGTITLADTANASWTIVGTANLATPGNVSLGQGGSWDSSRLEINANNATVTDINGVTIGNSQLAGNYGLSAGGNVNVDGTVNVNGNWNITTTNAGTVTDSNAAVVKILGNANLQSVGTITLADTANASWTIVGTANLATPGNVSLGQGGLWDSSRLEINANNATVTDINGVTIGNSQLAGNYGLSAGGNLIVDGTVNVNGNWNITTTNAGTVTDSNAAVVKILGNTNLQAANAITLADTANASWTIGGTANLTTSGNVSLGQGGLWDSSRLEINANNATVTDINGVTIGNSQLAGNYILAAAGNVNVDGTVNVNGNWNISTTNAGTITDSNSAIVKVLGNANLQAAGAITLADTTNASWTVGGTANLATPGNLSLGQGGSWDSSRLKISVNTATVTDINGVTIGDSQIAGNYVLSAGGNVNVDGTVNVNGNWNITTTNAGTITDSDSAIVKVLGNANLQSAGPITLAETTNASWTVGGTANLATPGNVSLGQGGSWDSSRLEINANNATVTDINGVTIGNSQVTGNYLLNAAGNINVDGTVNVNGNWNITTTNAGTITDSNAAIVNVLGNANLQSAGAITLADTANASWTIGGTANLATPGNVSLGQGGSWDSSRLEINASNATVTDINSVTIGNSQVTGHYLLNADGNVNVDGTVNVNGNWNISTTNAGNITDSNSAIVKVLGNANLQSAGAITLADTANASWIIGGTANLVTLGSVSLGQGGSWDSFRLEVNANNASVTDINGVTIGNSQIAGNYGLIAGGNVNVDGTVNVNGNWNITTTNVGTITDSDAAIVKVLGNANLQSAGAITLADTFNASWTIGGAANLATPGNVSLGQGGLWDSSRLEINANNATVTDNNGVTIGNSQIAGNYVLSAGGNVNVDGTVNVNGNWNIMTTNVGTITDSNAAIVKILGNANLQSAGAITLADTTNASWTVGGTANLATPGNVSLGQGGLWDSSRLEINANNATVTDNNGVTIGNSQISGNYVLSAGGNVNVDGTVNVNGNWNITTTNAGTITDSNSAIVKILGNINLQSAGPITLADTANAVWTIGGAANLATPGNVSLGQGGSWDSFRLEVNANNATVTDINGVTIGNSQLAGNYILAAAGNVNVDGTVNVNGNWSITSTNTGTITDSDLGVVKVLGNAILQSAGTITLADTANASWIIGGTAKLTTAGNVSLGQGGSWDSMRLEISANNATVTDINGVTIGNSQLAGNYILSAGGNVIVDGTVNVKGNWNITATNASTITDSNSAIVKILGNANLQAEGAITLADTANASWTIGGTANLATPGNVSLGQGGSWDSSRLEINANNATVTNTTGVTIGNSQIAGNYILAAGGNVNVDGTVTVNGNWNISTTNAGTITDSNSAVVKIIGNANLQSGGTITLADTTNASWTIGGIANLATPGNVSLGQGGLWDSSRLEINAIDVTVTDINEVTIGNSQIAGNYGLNAGGSVIVDGTVNVNGNWNITTTNAGTITDSNLAVVKVLGNANLQSASAITLADTANASWTIVGTANLATPGNMSLDQGGSWDSSRLEINANNATVTDINGVTIGNSQVTGNYLLNAAGNINVDGTVNVNGNWNITTTNAGTITDSNAAVVKVLGNANLQSAGAITLADTANASWTIGGIANLATPENVSLGQGGSWDSSRLEVNANSVTVTDINGVTIGNSQVAGNYVLSAGGNVIVDGTMNVNANWNISTTNAGTITDSNAAVVKVLGNANLQSAGAITLADTANASWIIGGTANLVTLGNVSLGQGGSWDSFRLEINANNANVTDINGVTIGNSQIAGNYVLSAGGNVIVDGTVNVNGNWNITTTNSGPITDSNSAIVKILGNTNLQSTGPITLADTANASWTIGGTANLATPGNMSLGQGGLWDSRQLSIDAANANVSDPTGVTLADHHIAGNYRLATGGTIDSTTLATITIGGSLWMTGESVDLAESVSNQLQVAGSAFFSAPNGLVQVGSVGTVQFGSLGLKANIADISEDSQTFLDGVNVGALKLQSREIISQSGIDTGAGVQGVVVRGDAVFGFDSATGSVRLIRTGLSSGTELADGMLMDNSIAGVVSANNLNGDFMLRNVAASPSLGTLQGAIHSLTLWQPSAGLTLGPNFHQVGQDLTIIVGMDVVANASAGISHNIGLHADWKFLTNASANLVDQDASVRVDGNAMLLAGGAIKLADRAGEQFHVPNGQLSVVSLGGGAIELGGAGAWQSKSLGIASENIQTGFLGNMTIISSGNIQLANPVLPAPGTATLAIRGSNLSMTIAGGLTNSPGLTISLGNNLTIDARDEVSLVTDSASELRVLGSTDIRSQTGNIEFGTSGQVITGTIRAVAERGDIALGNSQARMGELSLISNGISVREGQNTVLATAIALRQLDIDSAGSITNTQTSNSTARTGIATPQANLRAGTFIHLADTEIQRVNALARSNGTLGDPNFFQLNVQADRTGQAYLDVIGTNISQNAQTSPRLISGESLAELQRNASYIQSIGRQYGIYLKNLGGLEVQQMTSFGRGTNLFVETGRGQDLRVTHSIEQLFDNGQAGKMVLIAGGSLIIAPSAEIQVIDISGNPNTARIALQPQLEASAFNGGQGPKPGFQSTQSVLYASDTQADNGVQNVLQRVSTQFGIAGERGFQILIQYADGKLQMFDVASEIYASLIHGAVGTNPSGTIQSHGGAGDAAVVQRAIPFTDIFLASNVMLPTTAIFRRSSELFLFENAGQADLSLKTVDLTPAIDLVEDVLAPGRRVSLPMSSEIRVTPQLMNMEVRLIPTLEQIYTLVDNSTPVKSIAPKIVEVMIVRVGFDDVNEDGQPDPSEVPNRDDIQLTMLDNQKNLENATNAPGLGPSRKKLAPGEIDVVSKDVKESVSPTSADLQRWVDEYRSDPLKPSGVYAIISKDPSLGTKVLKVFSIRDFDVDGSNADRLDQDRVLIESAERSSQQDSDEQPDAPENKK